MAAGRMHSGRRPGETTTRAAIEDVARKQFAEFGYDRTSIRSVARQAGVDPALVTHFFGKKWELFLAVVELPLHPPTLIESVVTGDQSQVGHRLAEALVGVLDDETRRRRMLSMMRAATSEPAAAELVREFLTQNVLHPIAERLGVADAEYRAALVMSQVVGFTMARYVVALKPLAARSRERVVADLGATFQRYLRGELAS
ncbi:TetR family transcriptional regulator [Mycobacterium sp. M26]|uniref:TetR/AcrR family transcriptional regulator n=1 Tax=Mycobacterium sp. M26 TaxID=1762962 RepID=UPI000A7350CB|nr:TetR family transcriptional regulator [Mycobacterium sp. M26]